MKRLTLVTVAGLVVTAACAPRQPTRPERPFLAIVGDSLCVGSSATDPRGERLRYTFVADSGFLKTTGFVNSGETAYVSPDRDHAGDWHVCVRAGNESGLRSFWSDPLDYSPSGAPHAIDSVIGWGEPRVADTWYARPWPRDHWYRVVLQVLDPDSDSVAIKFLWGDAAQTGWSSFVPSGSVVYDSFKPETDGSYVIRVLLKDSRGTPALPDTIVQLNVTRIAPVWFRQPGICWPLSSPLVATVGGEVLTIVQDYDSIYCYGSRGETRWAKATGDDCPLPVVLSADGQRVYRSAGSDIQCLRATDGVSLWSGRVASDLLTSSPVCGPGGHIFVPTPDGIAELYDHGTSFSVVRFVPFADTAFEEAACAIGDDGTLYAVGYQGDRLDVDWMAVGPDGGVLWHDTLTEVPHGQLSNGLAVDGQGRLWTTLNDDRWSGPYWTQIVCHSRDGIVTGMRTLPDGRCPTGVSVDAEGRAYFARDVILRCSPDGVLDTISAGNYYSVTLCIGADGRLYSCPDGAGCWTRDGQELWYYAVWETLSVYRAARRFGTDENLASGAPTIGPDGCLYGVSDFGCCCLAVGGAELAQEGWPCLGHDAARSGWAGRR